ncbi:uncharacterized protein FFFS_15809 [Fusarium fujikuroi]|nr:uncharacterized protein FFFS_15809 [Fusarium fujikuroi]
MYVTDVKGLMVVGQASKVEVDHASKTQSSPPKTDTTTS